MVFAPLTEYYPDAKLFVKISLGEYDKDKSSRVKLKIDW